MIEHGHEPVMDALPQDIALGVQHQPFELVARRAGPVCASSWKRRQRPARRLQHRQRPDHPLRIGRLQPRRHLGIALRDQLAALVAVQAPHLRLRPRQRLGAIPPAPPRCPLVSASK